jgi:hypothetical protein
MDPFTLALAVQAGGQILGSVLGKQKAPKQADYKPVDPAAVQKQTIAGNLQNFGAASQIASQTNQFNQQQATDLLEKAMPGYKATQQKLMAQVNEDLASQNTLPKDVQDQISRFAAEKGVTRGTSGNFNGFNLVKDFGFNLLDWKNASRARAMNTLSTVYGMTPRVNPMSPMAMMVDPNTAIGVQGQNNAMAYNTAQAGLNAQAAASNYNRMMIAGAAMNAANFAGSAMMQGSSSPARTSSPAGQSGLGLKQTYTPLANAAPFKMPGQ